MASTNSVALVALFLVLLPMTAIALNDTLGGILEKVCEEVDCGKGNCTPGTEYPLGFKCECQTGWQRTRDDVDEDYLTFLPCVIPNCTLKYSGCQTAPPPVPEKNIPTNISAFDPCYWAYCGNGTCTENTTYPHQYQCQCDSGFFNLLNISAFPCYSECTLGSDCSKLGIKVSNSTSGTVSDGSNQASSYLPGKFHWMAILMVSVGMLLWK